MLRVLALACLIALLAACSSSPKRGGAYYQDDGPAAEIPADVAQTPDAYPIVEPLRPANMRPYAVMGRDYTPMTQLSAFRERGLASWYGRKFHGQRTASGEVYNMFGMTAAHKTLPIPSYARVTNLRNGKQVIVRINDRGPFHDGRVIDLSYAAAVRLDKLQVGTTDVEVELLLPEDIARVQATLRQRSQPTPPEPALAQAIPAPVPAPALPSVALADTAPGGLWVQAGAFGREPNAQARQLHLLNALPELQGRTHIVMRNAVHRVVIGPFDDLGDAVVTRDRVADLLGTDAFVIDRP